MSYRLTLVCVYMCVCLSTVCVFVDRVCVNSCHLSTCHRHKWNEWSPNWVIFDVCGNRCTRNGGRTCDQQITAASIGAQSVTGGWQNDNKCVHTRKCYANIVRCTWCSNNQLYVPLHVRWSIFGCVHSASNSISVSNTDTHRHTPVLRPHHNTYQFTNAN